KIQRFTAKDLYAPLPQLREFGLPIIEWNGKWRKNMKEAWFTGFSTNRCNTSTGVINYTTSELVKFAFLPCSADPNVYATPSECYSNPECAIMKFNVLHRELRHKAEEFGIKQNPDRLQVLEKLRKEPPENEEKAKLVFSYLSSFQNHFIHPDWLSLSQLAFIPIREKKQSNVLKYGSPQNCFFKSSEESFAGFFYYIDFGEKANKFLQSCGVKNEPSPIELAEFLINSSHDFLKSVGDNIEKYLAVLHRIAVEFHSIQRNQKLLNNMKRYPILLGMTKKQSEEGKNKDKAVVGKNEADNSLNQVERYVLATPNEIYINDNAIYQDIFEPLIFFSEKGLGCPLLTNSVKSSPNIKGVPKVTQKSKELQNLIKERSPLFFHEVRKADIVNNESWVKKLNVLGVDQIETTYVLAPNNITKIEHSNTCVISHDSWKNDWTLYIKHGELDTLDIASMISQYIYKKPQLKEATLISMLLMMPLNALKRKGFPVERIMSQQKSFRRVVENSDNPKRPRIDEQMTPNNYNTNRGQLNIAELENYSKQLQSTFPECDPNYIKSCLAQENSDHLMKVANKLAEQDYPKKQSGIRNDQEGSSPWNIFKNLTEYVSPGVSKSHADKPPVLVSRNTTEDLKRTLNEAVNSCRSNSGSAVDSQAKVNIVSESQSSYCDVMPGHSLKFIGMENGIELYIGKNLDQTALLSPTAQVPAEYMEEFKSIKKFKIFNTNNLWINLKAVAKRISDEKKLDLDVIYNSKTLESGEKVIQLETAVGAAIKHFKNAHGINVPRSRFLPVKSTSDLFLVTSDLYSLHHGELVMNPKRLFQTVPLVKLGDVTFGSGVQLKGTVIIVANHGARIDIPSQAVLENKVVSGNLRILDH
ncbi:4521_t:CDS:2, partial [Entrophospora sp. SA101]